MLTLVLYALWNDRVALPHACVPQASERLVAADADPAGPSSRAGSATTPTRRGNAFFFRFIRVVPSGSRPLPAAARDPTVAAAPSRPHGQPAQRGRTSLVRVAGGPHLPHDAKAGSHPVPPSLALAT